MRVNIIPVKDFTLPEPPPKDSEAPPIMDLIDGQLKNDLNNPGLPPRVRLAMKMVRADMARRRQHGIKKYGTELHPENGRDPLIDLYQEILDSVVYSGCVVYEAPSDAHAKIHTDMLRLAYQLRDMLEAKYAHVLIADPVEGRVV